MKFVCAAIVALAIAAPAQAGLFGLLHRSKTVSVSKTATTTQVVESRTVCRTGRCGIR